MKPALQFVDFLVATSVFTAFCAVGLCLATERLLAPAMPLLVRGLHLVVFGSTLVVYNVPRLLPRPYGMPRPPHLLAKWFFFFSSLGVVIMLAGLPSLTLPELSIAGICGIFAFAYFMPYLPFPVKKRLRDHGILKIIVLTSVWTCATGLLPIISLKMSVANYPLEIALRFVFVFALCILFDLRDMDTDISRNIATIPHKIGIDNAYRLVHLSLLLFVSLSFFQFIRYPVPGRLAAGLLTAIATFMVTGYVRKHPGHKAFVAMTDGMMLLYAALIMIQK